MSDSTPRMRAGDADRDVVIGVLQDAHANGRLSLEEFGERQSQALQARFHDELDPLVADLPERGHALATTPLAAHRTPTVTPGSVPATWSATIMSGRDITLAPGSAGLKDIAFWGGSEIHLDEVMGPGVTVTLELHAVMAGHDIYVPDGVRIVDESFAVMAGNEIKGKAKGDGSNGTLVLRGFLFWAGHTIRRGKDSAR